ncbi:MAG: winged helix-turn-helix transcriptional regulator [Chloroflexi bacterium]|nr:winged helix-turn-helix transcriptional regulator [Chloroflexota bacterium]
MENQRLYDLQAGICKTLSSPLRLRLVELLGEGERTVSDLVKLLGVSKSNVSQHLGIMREKGVVDCRREGGYAFYRLSNPKVLQACRLMREVLLEQFERAGELSRVERQTS